MSIPVDTANLAAALNDFGAGYLLTVSETGAVKAVTVEPTVADGALRIADPGGGSRRNIAANPTATVLFPPLEPRGYTLLVDGVAEVDEAHPDGVVVNVRPTSAVLHRPASHSDGPGVPNSCGHDCAEV